MSRTQLGKLVIEKIDDDRFQISETDAVAMIDEEVDGAQLMGMLQGKTLVGTTPGYVLKILDDHGKGHRLTVCYTSTL